ncbi:MAG: hypothetical protein FJ388_21205, partial [Verrucomicrobia bacterium]|nr:hypothetical protein [Verrucomicrobiota bacterium]
MTLRNFKSLYLEEQSQINPSFNANGGGVSTSAPGEEPRIRQTPADCVGLALSGGGIRSATFNLGLMQGLHDLKVLKLVQYLATVSGGGYIGGWWTAWRSRVANAGQEFPANNAG